MLVQSQNNISFADLERHLQAMSMRSLSISQEDFSFKAALSKLGGYLPNFSNKLKMVTYDLTNKLESLGAITRSLSDKKDTVRVAINTKNYADFSKTIIPVPENFKGSYIEYATLLREISKDVYDTEYKLVAEYQFMLSVFISNKETKLSLFAKEQEYFANVKKYRDNSTTKLSNFFPNINGNSLSLVKNVIDRMGDIVTVVDIMADVHELHSKFDVKGLVTKARECAELIDIVIDNINTGKYEEASPEAIQTLANGAYEVAKYIEFVSLFFYKVSVMINMTNILVNKLTGVKGD